MCQQEGRYGCSSVSEGEMSSGGVVLKNELINLKNLEQLPGVVVFSKC